MSYLTALAITVGVEVPLVTAVFWTSRADSDASSREALVVAVAANLFTHGTLWTVFSYVPLPYLPAVAVCETVVVLVEGSVFAGFGLFTWRRAMALSFAVNAVTTAIGLLL